MKTKQCNFVITVVLCTVMIFSVRAQVKLPALFSDNMVIQQQTKVPIWGWAGKNVELRITTSWNTRSYTVNTNFKGEWRASIQTPKTGGPYTVEILGVDEKRAIKNVLIGEVWLCSGQSNMEMPLKGFQGQPVRGGNEAIIRSTNDNIRMITVSRAAAITPKEDFEGVWQTASPKSTSNFSATAWYFGSLLQEVLQVPIGLIHTSYGGSNVQAWMSSEMLQDFDSIPTPKKETDIGEPNRTPTALFNGMLSPVVGYGIKGCIWYQGESNYDRPFQYLKLFPAMVNGWRKLWSQGDFPFYYAQIAPFDYAQFTPDLRVEKNNSAYLRESQLKAMNVIPNTGMAVLMDVGERNSIHPADKTSGGYRLAYWALAHTYGLEGFEYESPQFKTMEILGSTVTVSFDYVPNGLTSYGREITAFEIAGEDKVFYPATAVLRRKSVLLSAPQVQVPVAVRYAFKDFVEAQLFSTGGLPVSSFRTDEW